MRKLATWTAIVTLGAILGWFSGAPSPSDAAPPIQISASPTSESLLGTRTARWLDRWEQELSTGTATELKIPRVSVSDGWDEERKRLVILAHEDPEAAIGWIREHVPEHEQSQRIRTEVINPLMASDFRKAIDLLPALNLEKLDDSYHSHSFFWLFQYVPVSQLPELASSLSTLDSDDIRYRRALPDLVKEWARRDFDAAAHWLESGEPINNDLRGLIEAARVQKGSIPDSLGDILKGASDRALTHILGDLYDASLKLPGDPGEHAQKVLGMTPASQQERYASSFVSSWAQADPMAASEWALSFDDTELAINLLRNSLSAFYSYSPESAEAWESAQAPVDQGLIAKARTLAKEQLKRMPPP